MKKFNKKTGSLTAVVAALFIGSIIFVAMTAGGGDAFTFTPGETYAAAKQTLASRGWTAIVPTGEEPTDAQYPEITNCGAGRDAICVVDFQSGDKNNHLNVQYKDVGGELEWVVVGNE